MRAAERPPTGFFLNGVLAGQVSLPPVDDGPPCLNQGGLSSYFGGHGTSALRFIKQYAMLYISQSSNSSRSYKNSSFLPSGHIATN